ncbi:MAG: HAD-IIB family hydrolase [Pirellulales bacterium]
MRYLALACDYDGTLAHNGRVTPETLAALERLLASGRRLVMVTGRQLDELLGIFPEIGLFEWVVAENGGLLYRPSTKELRPLADSPKPEFVARLAESGVSPVATGSTIVATWEPHEQTVLEVIRSLGLELQVIFNKGAVMVLPAGVNKASGLAAALEQMGLSRHNVVGVGDAENDHAFLEACEFSAAVSNALDSVKHSADYTTAGARGDGVAELIERMLADDLAELSRSVRRHDLLLGAAAKQPLGVEPFGRTLLITGASGSGKSTAATALLERLAEQGYQFCILDPEGDYETFEKAVVLGASDRAPKVEEVLHALGRPSQSVVVNLIGLSISDRPTFFAELAPRLLEMRVRTGRPHWIVLDETHHLAPVAWAPAERAVPAGMSETMLITVHPDQVAPPLLLSVSALVAVGAAAADSVRQFCQALGKRVPDLPIDRLEAGHVLYWRRGDSEPDVVALAPGRTERRRHSRKYAEGVLPPDRSFYFRGREGKLKLRAQNLLVFLQMAEGVDDDTWLYHLRRGDYSLWFADRIKDDELADEARQVEAAEELGAVESRELIKAAIERRYTLPAASPVPVPGADAEARWN